jgi:Tfp pilus assembly protein PilN
MAVYEGARPRSGLYPRRRPEAPLLRPGAPELPRRRSRVALRSRKRPRLFGIAIGLIVVAFLLSFFSLVQTVRVSASSYDMDQLNQQLVQLQNQRQQDVADIDRLDRESAIRRQAIATGLSQLPAPIVIPAR